MRILIAAFIAACLCAAPANAQLHRDGGGTVLSGVAPIQLFSSAGAHQSITLSTSIASVLAVPAAAYYAQICASAAANYWTDGTAPTTTTGLTWTGCAPLSAPLASTIQLIAPSGSPVVSVEYYKVN